MTTMTSVHEKHPKQAHLQFTSIEEHIRAAKAEATAREMNFLAYLLDMAQQELADLEIREPVAQKG